MDEPGFYGITVYLWGGDSRVQGGAPLDACTVDLTPRKCQRFKPKPGEALSWTNVTLGDGKQIRAGQIVADKLGLVTLKRLTVTKGKHRITIRRR